MPTEKKVQQVEELREMVAKATIAIGADYRGLSVKQMQALRRQLRTVNVEVRVVKNTLLRLATQQAGREEMMDIAQGPTALAFGYDDVVSAAKALVDYMRQTRSTMPVHGAYADGRLFNAEELTDLASVPPRDVLLGRIAGGLQSPIQNFVLLISATLRDFAGLAEARAKQLETQG